MDSVFVRFAERVEHCLREIHVKQAWQSAEIRDDCLSKSSRGFASARNRCFQREGLG